MTEEAKRVAEILHELGCRGCVAKEVTTCIHREKDGFCDNFYHEAANVIETLSEIAERASAKAALCDIVMEDYDGLKKQLEQVTRERDAAIKYIDKNCETCAHLGDGEYVSNDCMDCIRNCNWQWRGVR